MGEPRREGYEKGRLTRADVLHSAIRLFSRRGYTLASVQQILDEAAITKGGFYHHWASKEDLALEIVDLLFGEYNEIRVARISGVQDSRKRLDIVLDLWAEIHSDPDWDRFQLVFALGQSAGPELQRLRARINALSEQLVSQLRQLLEDAQRDGKVTARLDVDELASLVLSVIGGMHMIVVDTHLPIKPEALIAHLKRLLDP